MYVNRCILFDSYIGRKKLELYKTWVVRNLYNEKLKKN
ncbi:DUF2639 domain-containing protein [Bacillus sporothermodurans]|nr:DUF2639 domain-containing protein [Heyndrickxia sporothermodurans]MBL5811793.1 DUF2639 domain-containing protein [Heyndrickxia sporothermodurans]MBL5815298.1 DUF2639 domain-containing protein [Heyndrickxia sporothermodurans]MBL5818701.1 DUF2639 domain-containing protein [Heyndrickxia sporothermodurans]MBL5843945.1 DUF2639 domain-containing protein [Heyndrickxia sporothermodurans]